MKTALLVTLTAAIVLITVWAQFRARQAEAQAELARAAAQQVGAAKAH